MTPGEFFVAVGSKNFWYAVVLVNAQKSHCYFIFKKSF